MNKIKLLYFSKALNSNHGGRYHSEAFLKEGQKSDRVEKFYSYPKRTIADRSDSNDEQTSPNSVKSLLKKNSFFQIIFFLRLNYLSLKEAISVIDSHDLNAFHIRITRNFLIFKRLKKRYPKLIISTEVNASPFDESFKNIAFINYFRRLERKSLSHTDSNFFVSSFLRKKIMGDHYNPERDYVVHNGVDLDIFNDLKIDNISTNKIVFGYIGTLDFHKNLQTLIDALKLVISKVYIDVKLMLVGDGPMTSYLKKYVEEEGLKNNVEFTGWINHDDIPTYLKLMDVAIHHSANPYMSPLKIFEYMAVGLPVIGPNIPAVREILIDKKDILLVENDANDIADNMVLLINDLNFRSEIASNGKNKIRNNYGWSHNADNILKILQHKCKEIVQAN